MTLRVAIGPSSFADTDPAPRLLLDRAGVQVRDNPFRRRLTEREIIDHLDEVDGLIAGLEPLNRNVISASPRLRAIAKVGIGVANVDCGAAEEHGVKVSYTPDAPADAVAEMTLAAMLALVRRIIPLNQSFHDGRWERCTTGSLHGARVLVVGYGRVGSRVAQLLQCFRAQVLVCDPLALPHTLEPGMTLVSLGEGLQSADIITLHATHHEPILDRPQFELMKKGVLLLNSAHGDLVVQSALVSALESGRVAGGWFDTFWQEPYSGPLLQYKQMLLTPHAATYTTRCWQEMEMKAVTNLLRDLGIDSVAGALA